MVGDGKAGVVTASEGVGGKGICVGADGSFEQLADTAVKIEITMKSANCLSNIGKPDTRR